MGNAVVRGVANLGAALTITGLRVRAVDVPMTPPVETAAGVVRTAPLVLVDLRTREGRGTRLRLHLLEGSTGTNGVPYRERV
jgi:hypothetical protein